MSHPLQCLHKLQWNNKISIQVPYLQCNYYSWSILNIEAYQFNFCLIHSYNCPTSPPIHTVVSCTVGYAGRTRKVLSLTPSETFRPCLRMCVSESPGVWCQSKQCKDMGVADSSHQTLETLVWRKKERVVSIMETENVLQVKVLNL